MPRATYAMVLLIHGVPPAYIAHQLGHVDSKQVHEKFARWINEDDSGRTRTMMENAFGATDKAEEPTAPSVAAHAA